MIGKQTKLNFGHNVTPGGQFMHQTKLFFLHPIDNDTGPDGEVFYYFVGASNNAGFQIDKRTGIITVKGNLDRESQNRYVLTVLAKNKGSIKGKIWD